MFILFASDIGWLFSVSHDKNHAFQGNPSHETAAIRDNWNYPAGTQSILVDP